MAIEIFKKGNNRQKILILILALSVLGIIFVVQNNFVAKPGTSQNIYPSTNVVFKNININFDFLKDSALEDLRVFEEIKPFSGKVGRENPFVPY